ncbi:MAG: 50S ribosomal protein L13 [Calditrichaeota bacterium]|nr:50S ribosomal protein L13 [Calditrichota bacterium]
MKTTYASVEEIQANRKWYVVDANNQVLGRFASQIATLLKGKHKASYAPHQDNGDNIIVINAEKIRLTGNKENVKEYFRHTTRPGSGKFTSFKQMRDSQPERVIEFAVKGMLPKNPLGRAMFRKLHVYAGENHQHQAQQPEELKLKY